MARNREPIVKRCRALGISPAELGYNKDTTKRNPPRMNKKLSEYGKQLQEKQKAKFIYGVLEKPFRNYFDKAKRMKGQAGENLIVLLEKRFDNVVFRAGYAKTRREARQMVVHNHFTLNGKKANIPSMQIKAGDVIATNETLERLDLTRDNKKLQTIEMQENAKENIRNRYLIPKDFFGGSTYENQQFAEAKFILGNVKTITDNWLQELTNKSPKYFKERGTRLIGTYDHLPSVIAIKTKLKNEGFKFKAEALMSLLGAFEKAQELGVSNDFEQFVKERGFEDFINNE